MNKVAQIKNVFAVLKDSANEDITDVELLKYSKSLVEMVDESECAMNVDLRMGPPPISELPLNVLFDSMGWQLLNRHSPWNDDYIPQESTEQLIENIINIAA